MCRVVCIWVSVIQQWVIDIMVIISLDHDVFSNYYQCVPFANLLHTAEWFS